MKVVLAGNFAEYERWRRDNSIRPGESIYVLDQMILLRRQVTDDDEVIEIGTFWDRKDSFEIIDELRRARIRGGSNHEG
jgi:hypothetical protein